MKKTVAVLGCGRVGRAIVTDLLDDVHVVVGDSDPRAFERLPASPSLTTQQIDLTDAQNVIDLVTGKDLAINALPGEVGFQTLEWIISAGTNAVDISFFEQDPFLLDDLAREKGVTAVVDCGVAPGLSNMLLGYRQHQMTVDSYTCYVGGLPVERKWPYEYKAPFSPMDVLEEYIRPARIVVNGQLIEKSALSDPEWLECEPVGRLEAFNTDGLRTLIKTMPVPNMKEKTLRYPGHREKMRILKKTGFLSKDPIDIDGQSIRPLDLTARLLLPYWFLEDGELEFTYMFIRISGQENGTPIEYEYTLYDKTDTESGLSSMARTTGFTCAATAEVLLRTEFCPTGICAPETVGQHKTIFKSILERLAERKLFIHKKIHKAPHIQ
jgi:saccharopine dehydrogenase-like NADP-dependent oxidoreductase